MIVCVHYWDTMQEPLRQLNCNHGRPDGHYCLCDEGWVSSGIHRDNPLEFHWCDARKADSTTYRYGPRQLTAIQEISAIIVSYTDSSAAVDGTG